MSNTAKTVIEHTHKHGSDITIVEHPASINLEQAFLELEESEQIHFLNELAGIDYEPYRNEEIIFHTGAPDTVIAGAGDLEHMIADAKAKAAADDAGEDEDDDGDAADDADQQPN